MARLLLTGIFILTATTAAHAQQMDSLATPVADSLSAFPSRATSCPSITKVSHLLLPLITIQPVLSRVAGVQVTPYSGAPGAWAAVRIRGAGSVTGYSQPLYVVDDIPVYNTDITPEQWSGARSFFTSNPSGGLGPLVTPFAPGSNPLLDLPVEDVASVEVVQDAAATARYGLQGGNGVVRITTRRGADGQHTPQPLRVRYAGYVGLQQVRQRYQLLDGPQHVALANVAWHNAGQPGDYYDPGEVERRGSADWQNRLFRLAVLTGHNLSLDGHTKTTRYYLAADFLQQNGVIIGSSLTRYSLRANVDQQLTQHLSIGLKVAGSQIDQRQPGLEPDAGPLLQQALLAEPLNTEYDAQGLPLYRNPLLAAQAYRTPRTRRLLAQLSATYQLRPDLTLRVCGSREQATTHALLDFSPPVFSGANSYRTTQTEESQSRITSWVATASLGYQHTFGQRHALTASLDYWRQELTQTGSDTVKSFTVSSSSPPGFPTRSWSRAYTGFELKSRPLHSPTLAAGYVFDGRFGIQASMHNDFFTDGQGHRTTVWFPGAELSWQLGKERFMAGVPGLSGLSLQMGAGRTAGSLFSLGGLNNGLDRTTQLDAGIRTAWLAHRLTFAATIYQRRVLHAQAFTVVTGQFGQFAYQPDVELRNRGLELTLSGAWQAGLVQGSTSLAAASNFTQVEELATVNIFTGERAVVSAVDFPRLETGQPLNRYFVFDQSLGPDGLPRYSSRTSRAAGTGLPRYTLSLSQQLRYRRFQLDTQFDGLFGYQILNPTLLMLDWPTGYTNNTVAALNYWTPANTNTTVPRPSTQLNSQALTDQNLASGNHVRLTQLILNYEVLNSTTRNISVWVGGQNLFVTGSYRGYDPNVSSRGASPLAAGTDAAVYPVARVWQVGVRGSF